MNMGYKSLAKKLRNNWLFVLLLLLLLLLRFPFEIALGFNKIPINKETGVFIFEDATYLITAVLIILKRESLFIYNIDFCSVIIFLAAPAFEPLSDYFKNIPSSGAWFRVGISVCLLIILLFFFRPKFQKRSFKELLFWFLISLFTGICFGVFAGRIFSIQGGAGTLYRPSIFTIYHTFIIQLSNAAVIEEPLFRGFLWGCLRKLHWKNLWIFLFQAALFWLGHIFYFGIDNYSFWIIIPLSALIFGLIVWRSRSIGTSMIVHGLYNCLAHFIW